MGSTLMALLKSIATGIAGKLGGIWGILAEKVLVYGGSYLINLVQDLLAKAKRSGKQKEDLQKLEEKQKDPKSTVEERADAYEDAINSGR